MLLKSYVFQRNYFPNGLRCVHNYISLNMLFYNTALHSDLVEGINVTILCFREFIQQGAVYKLRPVLQWQLVEQYIVK